MLNGIKWLTQRITTILVGILWIVVIPLLLTAISQWSGIIEGIDAHFHEERVGMFVFTMLIHRSLFALGWIALAVVVVVLGQEWGFFWFGPETGSLSSSDKEKKIDRSADIITWVIVCILLLIFSEAAIRIITQTCPPFLVAQ